jgi:hypothetical protein
LPAGSVPGLLYTGKANLEGATIMAQPKPDEKVSLASVIKLVEQLSPDEQLKLVQEIKQQELRRELMIGVEQLNRGEKISGEQVFQELRERHTERIIEGK